MAPLVFHKDRLLGPDPSQKVLKARDARAFSELAKAAEELEALKRSWEEEKKAMEESVQAEAGRLYEEKKEEGREEGLSMGREERALKIMDTVLASLGYLENIEGELALIVAEAARKILGDFGREDSARSAVASSLAAMKSERKLVLKVSPSDERGALKDISQIFASHGGFQSYADLMPDLGVPPGSCLLESALGSVEASLEIQMKCLKKAAEERLAALHEGESRETGGGVDAK